MRKYRIRHIILLAGVILLAAHLTKRIYFYFSYAVPPSLAIEGIEEGKKYAGLLKVKTSDYSPLGTFPLDCMVDGKEIKLEPVDGEAKCWHIDTKKFLYGPHEIAFFCTDKSFHRNKQKVSLSFFVDNTPTEVTFDKPSYEVFQGKTLHIKVTANKEIEEAHIHLLTDTFPCCAHEYTKGVYECFIPIDCEQTVGSFPLKVSMKDKTDTVSHAEAEVTIKQFEFPRQKGFKVKKEKLEQEKEVGMNDKLRESTLEQCLALSPQKKLWKGPFEVPTQISRISTPYGEIRVTPECGRYIHKAIDIANLPRAVVWASECGKVIVKERYLMSGNTVVIDHGMGVYTLYCHLDDFTSIEVGEMVKKGQPIGYIGKTGYASGPHLHWEMRIKNIPVDPFEWTHKEFIAS